MNYKEKYEEALERARIAHKDEDRHLKATLERIFPELVESEDESIRKEIYTYLFNELNNTKQLTPITDTFERWLKWLKYDEQKSDIIAEKAKTEKQRVLLTETDGNANIVWDTRSLDDAETLLECGLEYVKKLKATTPYKDANKEYWRGYREGKQEVLDKYAELEKQDEHTDKVESKFHEGDWVAYNSQNAVSPICQITKVDGDIIDLKGLQGERFQTEYWDLNENYHLWTIDDAKDGDVLACGDKVTDCPFIFHNLTEELNPRSYCGVNTLCHFQVNDENGGNWCASYEVRPATKEQRELLFQKMKEAGYEWDDVKKELKLLINNGGDFESENCEQKNCEQNPAWSEENDKEVN